MGALVDMLDEILAIGAEPARAKPVEAGPVPMTQAERDDVAAQLRAVGLKNRSREPER